MKHVEVTLRVVLDAEPDHDATGEVVAEDLRSYIESEIGDLWVSNGNIAYSVRYASTVEIKRAKPPEGQA